MGPTFHWAFGLFSSCRLISQLFFRFAAFTDRMIFRLFSLASSFRLHSIFTWASTQHELLDLNCPVRARTHAPVMTHLTSACHTKSVNGEFRRAQGHPMRSGLLLRRPFYLTVLASRRPWLMTLANCGSNIRPGEAERYSDPRVVRVVQKFSQKCGNLRLPESNRFV